MSFQNSVPTVTGIFWKRTYLFIEYDAVDQREMALVKGQQVIRLEQKQLSEHHYRAKLNLCIAQGREMLSDGDIVAITDAYALRIILRFRTRCWNISKSFPMCSAMIRRKHISQPSICRNQAHR